MEESGSEDEEEFKDSKEDFPPRDPIGLSSNQEQAPHFHNQCQYILQDSHSSWKTWKMTTVFPVPGKVLEFYFI